MTCWEILGIEPTRDPRQIEAAYEQQSKFATGEEAERLAEAYREALGREPQPRPEQVVSEPGAAIAEAAPVVDDTPLNASEQQVVREVVIQINALLNDSNRSRDPQIWKAILGEPPADQPNLRREIGHSLESRVRPMAENGTFPPPVVQFLGGWFEWHSLTEATNPTTSQDDQEAPAREQEAAEELPPQMVNFWPAVIGWIVGLAILAMLFGGMGGG
ncbi:J domain-containing protein [Marinobacter sp. M-5]|uniref:J domain-containing protein n=1 Tax=Marinobacter sp. M-5 TaxID=3081089 RepID=UPI00293C8761|nr:J domain-containing protein [Marinobacter sp. M-5]MDV3503748.1 J domain-containing protein [Marinobacter sp. M-5]